MVFEHCGNLLREGAVVCDQCGAEVPVSRRPESGAASRRQGRQDRPLPQWAGSERRQEEIPVITEMSSGGRRRSRNEGAGRPSARRGTPLPPTTGQQMGRRKRDKARPGRRMMVNWALIFTILFVLLIVGLIGGYVFLKRTDAGQLIMARMGKEANATALWAYGQELLEQGHIGRAIETYEQAYDQEPEREDIYQRLQQLADAYEAAGRTADAEAVYTKLYTEIDEKNTEAYREIMRIMENQDRRLELSSFLKMAYEKTGDSYFRRQREDLIPSTPSASEEAGFRKREIDVRLLSEEDYDIYYLFGEEGELPEDGQLYETPIHLDEGTFVIRAVAVSTDLISDELRIQYTISLPTPLAPGVSLAPGEYQKRQRIWLRHIESEDETLLKQKSKRTDEENNILSKLSDITIYYTIDGQTPTSNSPIFDGEPFYLPIGRCTLKAVAVNGYGKVSNILERTYKVAGSFKKFFNNTDDFSDFTIMKTSRDAFVKKFGTPKDEKEIEDATVVGTATQLTYNWGEARFCMTETGYVVYAVETASASMTGPRKTKVGMSEKDVTDLYRDMGQTYDQNGDRSIYFDDAAGYAKMYRLDANTQRIDYAYIREDNAVVTLSYYLENGKVVKLAIRCDTTRYLP